MQHLNTLHSIPGKIVMAADPGTLRTGYGVVINRGNRNEALDYGCICPPRDLKLSDRYLVIFEGIEGLIQQHRPDALVVETQFVQKNVQSAIKLGMARGIVILAARRQGIPVFEYSPTKAKSAVVGNGRATKFQVQKMVQHLLGLPCLPTPEDAADALALAICHIQAHPLVAKEV